MKPSFVKYEKNRRRSLRLSLLLIVGTARAHPLRFALPSLLISGLIFSLVVFFLVWRTVDRGMVVRELATEPIRLASNLFFAKMTAIGQLTIALLGATWALLVLQESRVRIDGFPVTSCFIVTNLSFLTSLLIYNMGYDFIVIRIFHHSAFDIDAPLIRMIQFYQQGFFIYGCLALVCTVFLGRQNR